MHIDEFAKNNNLELISDPDIDNEVDRVGFKDCAIKDLESPNGYIRCYAESFGYDGIVKHKYCQMIKGKTLIINYRGSNPREINVPSDLTC